MRRRQFLQYGAGLAGLAGLPLLPGPLLAQATPPTTEISLRTQDADVELIDGSSVFMWAFSRDNGRPSIPGPAIRLRQGQTVTLALENLSTSSHSFQILGMPGASFGPVEPGGSGRVTITAGLPG